MNGYVGFATTAPAGDTDIQPLLGGEASPTS